MIATSVPPRICTLVPPATGKVNICTTKTNALKMARVEAKLVEYVFLVFFHAKIKNGTVIAQVVAKIMVSAKFSVCVAGFIGLRIPSGMCILFLQ